MSLLFGDDPAQHGITSAIWYGDRSGNDIDLLIVQDAPPAQTSVVAGKFDIAFLHERAFRCLADNLDPIALEPLLTGTAVFGDQEWITNQLREIKASQFLPHVPEYLRNKSLIETRYCSEAISEFKTNDLQLPRWLKTNMTYAVSYFLLAEYYAAKTPTPTPFRQVLLHSGSTPQQLLRNVNAAVETNDHREALQIMDYLISCHNSPNNDWLADA